ncbi:hypothetical protein [Martelella sp.]|nr:hypothetical protein [Martelella sp.]|tara:strand:+ start:137 stop:568 length:432 start_codon:yes stop_codon:yes gene_type:complete
MATDSSRCRELIASQREAEGFLKQAVEDEARNKQEVDRLERYVADSQNVLIRLEQELSTILAGAVDLLRTLTRRKRPLPFLKAESAPEVVAQAKMIANERENLKEAKEILAYRREQLAQNRRDIPYFRQSLQRIFALQKEHGC